MVAQLTGKVAMITGAGSGFGRALSLAFAREGASIGACDINLATAQETVSMLESEGGQATVVEVDVSVADQVDAAVTKIVAAHERIDILVNCAGINGRSSVVDMEEHDFRRIVEVNVVGTFLTNRAVARQMIAQGTGGKIVNFASGRGLSGSENNSHYAASKGGVLAFTYSIGMELSRHGINVNAINPGQTDTGMTRRPGNDIQRLESLMGTDVPPHRRVGVPEDVVGPVLFLVTDASSHMYGKYLSARGG